MLELVGHGGGHVTLRAEVAVFEGVAGGDILLVEQVTHVDPGADALQPDLAQVIAHGGIHQGNRYLHSGTPPRAETHTIYYYDVVFFVVIIFMLNKLEVS